MLDGPLFQQDSITYGVNFASPLNDITGFHVVDQMPQDMMHVLFEGVIPYELTLLLRYFVTEKKLFTLQELNDYIECYSYSPLELNDRPSPIRPQVFLTGATVSQTCKQYACMYICTTCVLCYLLKACE